MVRRKHPKSLRDKEEPTFSSMLLSQKVGLGARQKEHRELKEQFENQAKMRGRVLRGNEPAKKALKKALKEME